MVHNPQSIFSAKLDASYTHIFKQAARRHLVMDLPKKARLAAYRDVRALSMRGNFDITYGTQLDQPFPDVGNRRTGLKTREWFRWMKAWTRGNLGHGHVVPKVHFVCDVASTSLLPGVVALFMQKSLLSSIALRLVL
jgi:hypothetical protein